LAETNLTDWPFSAGEMAARIRVHTWHRTPLGPVTRWPMHLRMATDLMLGTPLPTLILSGSDGVVLYNDAFIPFLGATHPALLGASLSTASIDAAARFRALAIAVGAGETVITDDNWLGLSAEPDDGASTRLACVPLRGARSEVVGIWAQLLTHGAPAAQVQVRSAEHAPPSAPAGLAAWVWNPGTATLHLTEGAAEVYGLLPHQTHGLDSAHFDFVHPLDQVIRSTQLDHSLASGRPYRCEFRIVRPCDQQITWIEERGHAVPNPADGGALMSTVLWGIHNPRRAGAAETSDARSVERYAAALEGDIAGIAFFGPDGVVREANDTYCAMHGIHPTDIAAGRVRWGHGTAPEWLTLFRRTTQEYEESGRAFPHEKECVRPNGQRWWGLFSAKRLSASEGVEYVIDISPRMLAENNLKESERWARTLLEGIPQIMWRSVDGGQWTWSSPQWTEITGQPQAQSVGLGWLDVVHPEDRNEAHAIWNRASWQQAFEADYRLWHIGENRYRRFKTRAAPLRDEAGQIREWLGTSTDIEDLEQLYGRMRVLVSELQHRTRNLLALVRSIAAQTIGTSAGDAKQKYADFNERLAALSRAQSLITRAESERVDLESLLRAELAALRGSAGATIEIRGPTVALPPMHAQTLALVVHELATNALKYGALGIPGGQLSVVWKTAQDEAGNRTLHMEWREAGVKVTPEHERRRGFGRELIEEALQFSLDAHTDLRFGPDGVACSIALPLANQRQVASV
jgi:PAS domain S-box-containing protein